MNKKALFILLLLVQTAYSAPPEKVTLYFFWGQGCPHCAEMEPFIVKMEKEYPNLEVKSLEVFRNTDNANLLDEMAQAYGKKATVVPDTFIGDRMIAGYNGPGTENITESMIINCSQKKCASPDEMLSAYRNKPKTTSTTTSTSSTTTSTTPSTTSTTARLKTSGSGNITLYFFWGQGCPHCAQMEPFIQQIGNAYPQVKVKSLEVFNNESNAWLFDTMAKAYGGKAQGVPTTFIGDKMIEGYVQGTTDKNVTDTINDCIQNGCPSPDQILEQYVKEHPTTTTVTATTQPQEQTTTTQPAGGQESGGNGMLLIGMAIVIVLMVGALLFYLSGKKTTTEKPKEGKEA